MLEVKVTTIKKAKTIIQEEKSKRRKSRKKSPIMEEYEAYLMNLERGKAITITLKENDKFQTIKYRLKNAAKSLGIKDLKIERAGNKAVFYKEVRPRTRKVREDETRVFPVQDESVEGQYAYEFEPEPASASEPEPESASEPEPASASEPAFSDAPTTESALAPTAALDLTHTPTPAPMPGQEEELLTFDFDEEWEEPMVHGHKTCEARTGRYAGTTFEAFDHQFVVTKVEQLPLSDISQKWFKQHGLFSPREFQEIWKHRHKGVFDPEQKVWLHHFSRGFEPPIEPDSDVYPEPEPEVQD